MLPQSLQFRSKDERPGRMKIVKRFDAQMIARKKQFAAAVINDCEGEHPAKSLHAFFPPLFPAMNDYFGIGFGAKLVPGGLQLNAQLAKIIEFTVVGNPNRSILVAHRLAAGRQIYNGQTTMTECYGMAAIRSLPVRSAMP